MILKPTPEMQEQAQRPGNAGSPILNRQSSMQPQFFKKGFICDIIRSTQSKMKYNKIVLRSFVLQRLL